MHLKFSKAKIFRRHFSMIDKQINLEIEKTNKEIINLKAHENDKISDILEQLQKSHRIPEKHSLVFKYKELSSERTLKSYLIGSEQRGNKLSLRVFGRRDELKKIEQRVQQKWDAQKTFEARPEDPEQPKFFATFPFPYVNGLLHCGHGFSLSKAEFASGFQRLKGKNVLFPFGFHCTGMPIVASANKLKSELSLFGIPPDFPETNDAAAAKKSKDEPRNNTAKSKKKGKIASKKSRLLRQYQIMQELGVPEEQIPEFVDPRKWVDYFTPKCFDHLKRFGCKFDQRRCFVTTDLNPFFSRFVEWQFNRLKKSGFVRFGKRMCIFAPKDGQPCADHDRSSGEGVQPQEYTAIKLKALSSGNGRKFEKIERLASAGKSVFLVAGTLRPETMYGQTNCFVKPNGDYVAIETRNINEIIICSEQSAQNMSFQGITAERGVYKTLDEFKGWDLLGLKVRAANSINNPVFVLPLLTISMEKATGIVTSVPSDSPDDYVNYKMLQDDRTYREKYHVSDEMVQIPIQPVISIPGYSEMAAADAVKKFKVRGPSDEKALKLAKEEVYLKGYYKGVMSVGPHEGVCVEKAKEMVRSEMIENGDAFKYFEPSEPVRSRSGENCVVAETNQWFLHYGEEPYKSDVMEYVSKNMNFYSESTRERFKETIDWMKQWACSRKFGLGTKLPFDKEWLIESLSDSTIYMAYYTIAHFFDSHVKQSKSDSKLSISAEDLSDDIFNAIFLNEEIPKETGNLRREDIAAMRKEFEYWYPLDLRVSGKDLINNHLVMCLYNHAFLFEKEKWPKSMFANGHVMIDAEKMSKSTGNFLTLIECIEQYGSDATRLALADAGDGLDDANFAPETCNAAIIRLTKEMGWITAAMEDMKSDKRFRTSEENTFADQIFDNEINLAMNDAEKAFSDMKFKIALNKGFYSMCNSKNNYSTNCGEEGLNKKLVEKYIKNVILVIAPICSHWSEHLYEKTGNEKSLFANNKNPVWPLSRPVDPVLHRKSQHLRDFSHQTRLAFKEAKKKSESRDFYVYIFVTQSFPPVRLKVMKSLANLAKESRANLENGTKEDLRRFTKNALSQIKKSFESSDKKEVKQAMMFASFLINEAKENGEKVFEINLPFDEKKLLERHSLLMLSDIEHNFKSVVVLDTADLHSLDPESQDKVRRSKILKSVAPGKPAVFFGNSKL